jgi:uncharacterized membrane protein YdbT with pleckstrin-like domain
MLGHALIAAVLALIGLSLLFTPWSSVSGGQASFAGVVRWVGAASLVAAAAFFGVGLVRRNATEMAVTNKRVIVKSGLADRRTIELLLPRIESIAVEELPKFFSRLPGPWNSANKSSVKLPGSQSPLEQFRLALSTIVITDAST